MPAWVSLGDVKINDGAVQSFIRAGGAVARELDSVARGAHQYNIGYISAGHIRSGRLLKGLWWNRTHTEGPLQGVARAGSSARHTLFFLEGTASSGAGFIQARGKFMVVPLNRRTPHLNTKFAGAGSETVARHAGRKAKGVSREQRVRGQRTKPFLQEGLAHSLARHGLS